MTFLSRTSNGYRSQTSLFDEAESDFNHGPRNLHPTASATGALSCGTSDMAENEQTYLEKPVPNRDPGGKMKVLERKKRLMVRMRNWKAVSENVTVKLKGMRGLGGWHSFVFLN